MPVDVAAPVDSVPVDGGHGTVRSNERRMGVDRAVAAPRTPRQTRLSVPVTPPSAKRHFLDSPDGRAVARRARALWAVDDGLRSVSPLEPPRAVAESAGCLGSPGAKEGPDRLRVRRSRRHCGAGSQGGRRGEKKGATAEESRERQGIGQSRGGLSTKIHVLCEGAGQPISVKVTAGQAHESTQAEPLLDSVGIKGKRGRPRRRFDHTAGDKAYDSVEFRRAVRRRGSRPVIPHRRDHHGEYPRRALGFDKKKYRQRNVVERLIGRLKEYRRIATRYDKLRTSFTCFILLGCVRIWLKNLLSYTA